VEEATSFGMVWNSGEAGWGGGWRMKKFISGKVEKAFGETVKGLRLLLASIPPSEGQLCLVPRASCKGVGTRRCPCK